MTRPSPTNFKPRGRKSRACGAPADGVHRVRVKKGAHIYHYHYAWRGGPRFWSSSDDVPEGSAAYWRAYKAATARTDPDAGTFRMITRAFLESRAYTSLEDRTRADHHRHITHKSRGIDEIFGPLAIEAFNDQSIRGLVYDWRDSFESDRTADLYKGTLAKILKWAVDRALLRNDWVRGIPNRYKADRTKIIWTPDEIEAVIEKAPPHLARAMILATETGLRPGDQIALTRDHIRTTEDGKRYITITTAKRSRDVYIPVTRRLGAMLDATPVGQHHILVGKRGQPWKTTGSLSHAMTKVRQNLKLREELNFYDARSYCVTRLVRAGVAMPDIAQHMGWSPSTASRMLDVYAKLLGFDPTEILAKIDN